MINGIGEGVSLLSGYEIDRNNISLLDIVKIDERTCGRMDLICMSYYHDISYLPLLLEWNHITDIAEQKVGDLLEIPDMDDLSKQLSDNQIFTFINDIALEDEGSSIDLPGVVSNTYNKNSTKSSKSTKSGVIIGNPTLNIETKETSFDSTTGTITYY